MTKIERGAATRTAESWDTVAVSSATVSVIAAALAEFPSPVLGVTVQNDPNSLESLFVGTAFGQDFQLTPGSSIHIPVNDLSLVYVRSAGGTATASWSASALGSSPLTSAFDYYVDATLGSDANDGRSALTAWQTIAKVNAASFSPGDRIAFKRGETWSGTQLTLDNTGVTIGAYGSGSDPILKNSGVYGSGTRIIVVQADSITVENLKLEDCADTAIFLDNATMPDNTTIQDCEITDAGSGVFINGTAVLITRCNIHDLNMIVDDGVADNDYGAVGVWCYRGSDHEISYNVFNACRAASTDYTWDGGAVEFYAVSGGTVSDVRVHHNQVINSDGLIEAGSSGVGTVTNVRAYNNIVVNSKWLLRINNSGTHDVNTSDFRVEHNTFIQTADAVSNRVTNFNVAPAAGDCTLQNNTYYTRADISSHDGFTHLRNCIYVYMAGRAAVGYTPHATELVEDPRFTNLGGGDYMLQDTSPAINLGTDLGYTDDYAGNTRPIEILPDAGAYENQNGYTSPTISYLWQITHDGSDLSEYDATSGGVSATVAAALAGTAYGLRVNITDVTADYVQKNFSGPASGKLRLRFYIDPNNLTMNTNDSFNILKDDQNLCYLNLIYTGATYRLALAGQDDDANWHTTMNVDITDEPHYVELYFTRESADGQNDGHRQIWVDGLFKQNLYYDNFNKWANLSWFRFGAVGEIDVTTSGDFYLDEFSANDDGYLIGA